MMKLHILWALVAAAALASCGGSDSSPAPTPAPTPTPAPAPTPIASDRIEPLDTALRPSSAVLKVASGATKNYPAGAPVPRVTLGALVAGKSLIQAGNGTALKIGEGRAIPATASAQDLASLLSWNPTADGGKVAAVAFSAEGARAIRLAVLAEDVPEGTVLRFYGAEGDEVVEMNTTQIADLRAANMMGGVTGDAARMVWGPDTTGAVSTLEVQLPANVDPGRLRLAVPHLSHLTTTVEESVMQPKTVASIGDAASCHLDVMCRPDLEAESRSLAKIMFSTSAGTFMCTGALLNDAASSRTPYFLTASHCIGTQDVASTLVAYWFFRAASCNSAPRLDSAMTRTVGGAQLLFANTAIDNTLLQLNTRPPARVVYAGSYFGADVGPGFGVTSVHQPRGDLQKYSVGQIMSYAVCTDNNCADTNANVGSRLRVSWQQGATELGSSGAPLFAQLNSTRYVVGTLWGGASSCQNPSGADYYGRFQNSYAQGINKWLN
ncbi:trypsin-like serine peptidase [Ottowia thiooxydans]|uniref:trypsin-like serine peptidase n=1 Tax=Ottowia thiooxydans TaxID=219182 RepID=UPI000421BD42|nr:hypothetical protein [Ottowia thiooxydans]